MHMPRTQLKTNMLLIYMITALLFLTSVTLHIHTQEAGITAEHGVAVSISTYTGDLSHDEASGEIVVSPDSALKLKQSNNTLLAIFLLIAVIVTVLCRTYIGRIRESHVLLPVIPFFGAPQLRAPPR